jgi:uncharacterized coiled-coil protein SlyX
MLEMLEIRAAEQQHTTASLSAVKKKKKERINTKKAPKAKD